MGCGANSKNVGSVNDTAFYTKRDKLKFHLSKRSFFNLAHNSFYLNQNIFDILKSKANEKFIDDTFPATLESLIPNNTNDPSFKKTPENYVKDYYKYKWRRAEELFGENNICLFKEDPKPTEVNQGALGSCYLLCAISGLCQNPHRLRRLFVVDSINSKGAYAVRYFIQGIPKIITVDDFIPCHNRKPTFSTSKESELWLIVLEKAYAKINKNYMRIWLGTPHEALATLTEAPCKYYFHKGHNPDKAKQLWDRLLDAQKKKWILCTNTEDIVNVKETGLVPFHAYSIIKVYELSDKSKPGGKVKLLKLRNPWGNKNWKGQYNEHCKQWSLQLKKQINEDFKSLFNNGCFIISFDDFVVYFPWTFICNYEDNYYYNFSVFTKENKINHFKNTLTSSADKLLERNDVLSLHKKQFKKSSLIESLVDIKNFVTAFIEVTNKTHCSIALHQPQKRYFEENDYQIPMAIIIVAKYNPNGSYTLTGSEFVNWDKLYIDRILEPGEYHIFAKSFYFESNYFELVISTYAERNIDIFYLDPLDVSSTWLEEIMINIARKSNKKTFLRQSENNSFCSVVLNDNENNTGFGIFYYENCFTKGKMNVYLNFSQQLGLKMLNANILDENRYFKVIGPSSYSTFIFEFTDLPWNCKINWSHLTFMDFEVEEIEKRYLNDAETDKEQLCKNLTVYTVSHECGYLIIIDNKTKSKYQINLILIKIENLAVEEQVIDIDEGIECLVNGNSKYYMNFKTVDINKPTKLKIGKSYKKL